MSAIWGNISFNSKLNHEQCVGMKIPYESKCKIDRIEEYLDEKVYFACGLQEIVKESSLERLPIVDKDKKIVFTSDCILDNRAEVKSMLGYDENECVADGRLIFELFLNMGTKCFNKLRGLYSIAIYNMKQGILYLVADPISSRCLYYYQDSSGNISFSTLLQPIISINKNIEINDNYIKDFLTAPGLMPNIVPNETPYKGIYKLNPGSYLEIRKDYIEEKEYFSIDEYKVCNDYSNEEQISKMFKDIYKECVDDAVNTMGNVASSMSSGLDSATVSVLAAKKLKNLNKTLYTYTYIPDEKMENIKDNILDETKDVQKILEMYPNMQGEFVNNEGRCCIDDMEKIIDIMEIPIKAYVNFPNLCEIYEKASENNCTVVLIGQNGNSTVSHGYIDDVLCDLFLKKKYITFLKYLNNYSTTVKESRKAALQGCIGYFRHTKKVLLEAKNGQFDFKLSNRFLAESICDDYPLEKRYKSNGIKYFESIPTIESEYKKFMKKKALYTYLGEFETKMGLKYGVVLRDPTADIRMLSFCYHMPYKYFAYNGVPRWLVRNNFQEELPYNIVNNWMRYGVQNADCFIRMKRDWKRIGTDLYEKFGKITNDKKLNSYINMTKVYKFFEQNKEELNIQDEIEIDQLMYIFCALEFYQYCKNTCI